MAEKIPGYFTTEEEYYEDLLKKRKREEAISKEEKPEYVEKPAERVVVTKREAIPRFEPEPPKPLNFETPEIIGSLFDRVAFLKTRIAELAESIKAREAVHKENIGDIDLDIQDKEDMSRRVADMDEKRNLMLDISNLRREKRFEDLQFWRDITELKHEFRELLEQYETEVKIAGIFEGMGKERLERLAKQ